MALDFAGGRGLAERLDGELEVDRPGSLGVLRAVGLAVVLDAFSVPIALLVAGMPLLKLMSRPTVVRRRARRPRQA